MLPLDARAAAIGDFLESHFPIRLYPDAARNLLDCEGRGRRVRIAAVRNHASTNELVRQVKQAALVYAETPESNRAHTNGQADVKASTRLVLLDFSTKLSGARVLDDAVKSRSAAVLCYPLLGAREIPGSETPRVHHAAQRRGSRVAAGAGAQQPMKLRTIGFLGATTAPVQKKWTDAFVQRLHELDWIEGRSIAIEYRWAEGRTDRVCDVLGCA